MYLTVSTLNKASADKLSLETLAQTSTNFPKI